MTVGKLLRSYRKRRKILCKDMAKTLGVSHAQLSKIEMGKHDPKGELTLRILDVLMPNFHTELERLDRMEYLGDRPLDRAGRWT